MQNTKRWIVLDRFDEKGIPDFMENELSPVIRRVLKNRGINCEDEAKAFLHPSLSNLHDPYMLCDMDKAILKIKEAVESNKKITIYGDYDADGITSTSILLKCLKSLKADVDYYIPSRIDEGYGLNKEALEYLINNGTQLLITVDCGVTSIDEVKFCKENGTDIIITDHHECGDDIPDTLVINPKRKDSKYPFKELAGVGVAFKLIQALSAVFNDIDPFAFLDLASIGTIADIVPLIDENRIIVKHGLKILKNTKNSGIMTLTKSLNLNFDNISSGHVAYMLAPRINAIGRIDDARYGVELFTTDDPDKALEYASMLCESNKRRQEIEEKILKEAEEKINEKIDSVIVLKSADWHIGVVGIVASRLVEKYYRPVILLCQDGETLKGSARSIKGFNMFEALEKCSDLLIKFGGHELAAGLSLEYSKFEEFKSRINSIAKNEISDIDLIPMLNAECTIEYSDITLKLADELNMLEPFGTGNPVPLFILKSAKIEEMKAIGVQDKHLKMKFRNPNGVLDAIAFNMGYNINAYSINEYADVLCSIEKNIWNGRENPKLIVKDIRQSIFKCFEREYYLNLKKSLENLLEKYEIDEDLFAGFDIYDKQIDLIFKEALKKEKTLVLLSNISILDDILEIYGDYELYIENNLDKCFYSSDISGQNKTGVIVCPDPNKICYDGIKHIYVLDNLVDYTIVKNFCSKYNIMCHISSLSIEKDIDYIESIMPSRNKMEKIYIFLKKSIKLGNCIWNIEKLSNLLCMDKLSVYFSLKALRELGILSVEPIKNTDFLVKVNPEQKNSIENSNTVKMFEKFYNKLTILSLLFKDMRGNIYEH